MRQQGSSSTEQNYRRIRNKFNGNGNAVEMRKLQNGGLVYPVQPPKSAPLPRKMYHPGNGNAGSQNPGSAFDNQAAMASASSVNDLRFVQHQQPNPRDGRENGNFGPPAGMMQRLSFEVEMVPFLESPALFSNQGS